MLRRLVADPEFGTLYGKTGYNTIPCFHAIRFGGAEGGFVEVDGTSAVANRQPWSDGRGNTGTFAHSRDSQRARDRSCKLDFDRARDYFSSIAKTSSAPPLCK